jgi:hypothetical protein
VKAPTWSRVVRGSLLILFVVAASGAGPDAAGEQRATPVATPVGCPVTQPNGVPRPEFGRTDPPQAGSHGLDSGYGNDSLWTELWMWDVGQVPVPASHLQADGSFGPMKWAWYRHRPGRLTIEGRRLDAPAPPLQAWIPDGYGDVGLQVAGIAFPTVGCWEITGRLGEASLTFVTQVIPPASYGGTATPSP